MRSLPKSFGAIRNANNITFQNSPTVWDSSFEKDYDRADNEFPELIAGLQSLAVPEVRSGRPLEDRLLPLIVTAERTAAMGECIASLIARSPSFRHRLRLTAEYFRGRLGLSDPTASKSLIAANAQPAQKSFSEALRTGGKYVVLFGGDREFIFGDGFLHNFVGASLPLNPRCLVPLTPQIAIFYSRPMSYMSYPKAFLFSLNEAEVEFVNWTVRLYSERYIFFRSLRPDVGEEFTDGKHYELRYHRHPWLEELEAVVANGYFGKDSDFYSEGE